MVILKRYGLGSWCTKFIFSTSLAKFGIVDALFLCTRFLLIRIFLNFLAPILRHVSLNSILRILFIIGVPILHLSLGTLFFPFFFNFFGKSSLSLQKLSSRRHWHYWNTLVWIWREWSLDSCYAIIGRYGGKQGLALST